MLGFWGFLCNYIVVNHRNVFKGGRGGIGMKKKTLLTLLLAGTVGLLGCGKREYSERMHGDGIVKSMTYTPKHSHTSTNQVIIPLGDGPLGLSMGGGVGIMGTTTDDTETTPESYEVVIECENKTFKEIGSVAEKVYDKLKEGQKVDVSYKEVYGAFYKDTNNDGEKELVKRKLVNYKFLDANPKEN